MKCEQLAGGFCSESLLACAMRQGSFKREAEVFGAALFCSIARAISAWPHGVGRLAELRLLPHGRGRTSAYKSDLEVGSVASGDPAPCG